MKRILLSTDGPVSLYEVPDKIAENLLKYCKDFLDWVYDAPETEHFRKEGYCSEDEFINYLNTMVEYDCFSESRFIKTIASSRLQISKQYKNLPYFNF